MRRIPSSVPGSHRYECRVPVRDCEVRRPVAVQVGGDDVVRVVVHRQGAGRGERGETLVIDTRLMREGQFDRTGAPHSDQVHLMERIRMQEDGRLRVDMVIEDPVMFTGPWEVTRYFERVSDQQMMIEGTYCENQRNPFDAQGNQSATLPGEG